MQRWIEFFIVYKYTPEYPKCIAKVSFLCFGSFCPRQDAITPVSASWFLRTMWKRHRLLLRDRTLSHRF